MKTLAKKIRTMSLASLLMLFLAPSFAQNGNGYITINGNLKDAKTKNALFFAYVTIPSSHVGTVTNSEGNFTFKISPLLNANEVEFSHLGYITKRVPVETLRKGNTEVLLEPASIPLDEITVRPIDVEKLVADAIAKIPYNYSDNPNMLTGFYRETIKQRRDYISISEAVLDIYKAPYKNLSGMDRIKIFKGRKSINVKKADTLAVKLQGGPNVSLLLDIAKNIEVLFPEDYRNYYNFTLEDMVTIDKKINYVVGFAQKEGVTEPLYYGRLYIDTKNLAITNAQFSLNIDNKDEAAKLFVLKKPRGVKFMPTSTSYYVNYTEYNGRYYLSYVRNELSFKANWNRRIFNTSYTVTAEMAITDRDLINVNKFPYRDILKSSDILSETVAAFNDDDFWGEYNFIQPEESIQDAIKKYGKRLKRLNEE
ncbi:MAG: carboxypeptidase-like regulatory domain-containing protein [Bacteroidales bacterium]|nr:carboxypeptidase-like regulatory domain-containing protein [Bacteroidales bacterium]MDD4384007.1 carboxypeptidase-like regulatory domain-containing protein [Bacteroidales bacterium]